MLKGNWFQTFVPKIESSFQFSQLVKLWVAWLGHDVIPGSRNMHLNFTFSLHFINLTVPRKWFDMILFFADHSCSASLAFDAIFSKLAIYLMYRWRLPKVDFYIKIHSDVYSMCLFYYTIFFRKIYSQPTPFIICMRRILDWNNAILRDFIAATGLMMLLKLDSNRRFFSPRDLEIWWMTSNKTLRHFFYTTSRFVHHFKTIGKFKLDYGPWTLHSGQNQLALCWWRVTSLFLYRRV